MTSSILVLLTAACLAASAQTDRPAADWQNIDRQLEAVRAAVAARDLSKARDAASALWLLTSQEARRAAPTPADYLKDAEARAAATPKLRPHVLPWMAKLAFEAGDLAKAGLYARETLQNPSPYAAGDPVHDGNMVLGRIALRAGDVPAARAYLLAAAGTSGTSVTRRFGPNMSLAKELTEKGEFAAVAEYLRKCRAFMTDNRDRIDDWIALLEGGRKPDFSRNLGY